MFRQNEISEILTRVDNWSPEDRAALVYQLLRGIGRDSLAGPPRNTLETALGIGRGEGAVPTDAEVDQIMSEHRQRKYQ
jgi:hypothetical protein